MASSRSGSAAEKQLQQLTMAPRKVNPAASFTEVQPQRLYGYGLAQAPSAKLMQSVAI